MTRPPIRTRALRVTLPVALLLAVLVAGACGGGGVEIADESAEVAEVDAGGAPWFDEVAAANGIDFAHVSGADGRYLMPEIMTTGAALVDVDGDGDLDAYLVQAGGAVDADPATREPNRLYLNRGDGTFEDATDGSGADDRGYGMGVTTGDYDRDGDEDLYVTNLGANALLRNDGGGRFTDVTATAGVAGKRWSASAAFVDADADGDLDLFVTNYVYWSVESELVCRAPQGGRTYCSPKSYKAPAPDAYFENLGDGTFTDASEQVGLREAFGNGLGVLCADFDGDGRPEIFVANDGTPNQLWDPQPDGTFRETALRTGCAVDDQGRAKAGMGVAAADIDADGDEDLLVVNLTGEDDSFYRNDGGQFVDRTPAMGLALVSRRTTRFGVALRDFDHDGLLDLFHANGRVTQPAVAPGPDAFAEENTVLRGLANGRFEEVLPRGGVRPPLVATSRAAAFGDVDGDGDVDVLICNKDGRAHLLRNVAASSVGRGERWAALDLRLASGAAALGASVDVTIGGRTTHHEVRATESYCSASSTVLHLGLGEVEAIDAVQVRWPDGTTTSTERLDAGAAHRITQE
ncbi:MAG: CRTAC1 family protein [Planctomycetota bacterium]